jgi:hypothetical protein
MSTILPPVLNAVGAVLATLIASLIIAIQRKVLAKLDWELPAAQENVERAAVEKAVLYVEGWAARELEPTVADRAGTKLAKAKDFILGKCPWLTDVDAEAAIEAALARLGLGPTAHSK